MNTNIFCAVAKTVEDGKATIYETTIFKRNVEGKVIDSLTIDSETDIDELIEYLERCKEIIAFNKERES